MTDIKSAIEVVNKYLIQNMRGRNFVSDEQIELENSLIFLRDYVRKTSKAWEEVLNELEKLKIASNEAEEYYNYGLYFLGKTRAYERTIDIINQHLAEIK